MYNNEGLGPWSRVSLRTNKPGTGDRAFFFETVKDQLETRPKGPDIGLAFAKKSHRRWWPSPHFLWENGKLFTDGSLLKSVCIVHTMCQSQTL